MFFSFYFIVSFAFSSFQVASLLCWPKISIVNQRLFQGTENKEKENNKKFFFCTLLSLSLSLLAAGPSGQDAGKKTNLDIFIFIKSYKTLTRWS